MRYKQTNKKYQEALQEYNDLRNRLLKAMPAMPGYGDVHTTVLSRDLGSRWNARSHVPNGTYAWVQVELEDRLPEELPELFRAIADGKGLRSRGIWFDFHPQAVKAMQACLNEEGGL